MYTFKIKLLDNEDEVNFIKTELKNFKNTLPWAKLDMVGLR